MNLRAARSEDSTTKSKASSSRSPVGRGLLGLCVVVFVVWDAGATNPPAASDRGGSSTDAGRPAAKPSEPALGQLPRSRTEATPAADVKKPELPKGRPAGCKPSPSRRHEGSRKTAVPSRADCSDRRDVRPKLLEASRHGPPSRALARRGRRGVAYCETVSEAPRKGANMTRIRRIVRYGGIGIGSRNTADALSSLPGPVSLGFAPVRAGRSSPVVASARNEGHEILLQSRWSRSISTTIPARRPLPPSLAPEQKSTA